MNQDNNLDFKKEQMKFERVRTAYDEKLAFVNKLLKQKNLKWEGFELYLRAIKADKTLEVWAKDKHHEKFELLISYSFCEVSGTLGPKRKQGDYQTPEGFYFIDRFNPVSNFYLSLGINYPNASDKIIGKSQDLGGDIFIHGDCVTVGCIPLTNDKIKELYLLCIEAKQNGQQKIPVHIFPMKLGNEALEQFKNNPNYAFWSNLKAGYDLFKDRAVVPVYKSIDKNGRYVW